MAVVTGSVDAAIVEFADRIRIDSWWQRQRRLDEAVLEFCDESGFPVQALYLPCSQAEGNNRDQSCSRKRFYVSVRLSVVDCPPNLS